MPNDPLGDGSSLVVCHSTPVNRQCQTVNCLIIVVTEEWGKHDTKAPYENTPRQRESNISGHQKRTEYGSGLIIDIKPDNSKPLSIRYATTGHYAILHAACLKNKLSKD